MSTLTDAKCAPINGKTYQTIGVINLNEIINWSKIQKSSPWVNVNFQAQSDNRDAKHFSYNFLTKNTGDLLNFTLKLIDDNNKKFPIVNFLPEFIA